MTGRTHDLAAFTAVSYAIATQQVPQLSLGTALFALAANFIGGLAPDLDQPTADLWRRLPAGSVFSRMIAPILGGHRYISHSILGIVLFGFLLNWLLKMASTIILVDMHIVWWAFMLGFVSHLIVDSFTREGVPWLFPIPIKFGFPPFKALRVKTGGFLEKGIVFPSLLLINIYLVYTNYGIYLTFLRNYIK